MSASDHLSDIQFKYHKPTDNSHQISSYNEHGEGVGFLRWSGDQSGMFTKPHEITALGVAEPYQQRGIAKEMYRQAKEKAPVTHSTSRTKLGERFAKSTGDKVPPKPGGKYLGQMKAPPVGWDTL